MGAEGIGPSTSILPLRQVAEEATTLLGVGGLEPPASSLSVTCSNRLSYTPEYHWEIISKKRPKYNILRAFLF